MTHLGCGGNGESYGDNLTGFFDKGKQPEIAAGEQVGLAGAGGRLHQDASPRIEREVALSLIGRI